MKKPVCFMMFGVLASLLSFNVNDLKAEEVFQKEKAFNFSLGAEYVPYYFKWKEKTSVKEEGWMHGVKLFGSLETKRYVFLPVIEPSFSIYGGDVDYKGKTWGEEPLKSKTNYNGWNAEIKFSYKFCYSGLTTKPYLALGREYWKRSVDSSIEPLAIGYTERWSQDYVKLGILPSYGLGKSYYVYGDLYVKYPFNVKNRVSAFDVTVKPEGRLGYGAELGIGVKDAIKKNLDFYASLFYERDKFGKSDTKWSDVVQGELYQPESKREIYGLKLGIRF